MSDQLFERAVHDWLEDGSDRTPPAAIEAVLLAVKTTPQDRTFRIPQTFAPIAFQLRLAAVLALVAIVGAMVVLLGPGGPFSPTPTPTPSTQPPGTEVPGLTIVDTSDWIAYTSERYGFDVKRPPNWSEDPAHHDWTMADVVFPSTATEWFEFSGAEGFGVIASIWSVVVEAGTSADAWIAAYCPLNTEPCDTIQDGVIPMTMDGHPGSLIVFANDVQAFFLVDDRMYVAAVWRPNVDQSTSSYGSTTRLLRSFLSTMTLRPGGPAQAVPPSALTESFTSERYGYSINLPGDWTVTPASALWIAGGTVTNWDDAFTAPGSVNEFRAASVPVPEGVSLDEWVVETAQQGRAAVCAPARATLGEIVIDGLPARIRTSCDEVEATVVVDGRLYLFTMFLYGGQSYSTAGGRALFEAMMASVQLTPETAEVAPSPGAS